MDKVIVACVQQRLRLHEDSDGCRRDLARFLRMAQAKGAQLIVFPELLGTMAVPPLLPGLRAALLKRADQGRRSGASLWTRTKSKVADTTASMLRADLRQNLSRLLVENPGLAWDATRDLFASAAQEYGLTIVAGSGYFRDEVGGQIVNQAVVFGPQGNVVGRQARVSLSADDVGLAVPATEWSAVDTEVGRIGLLLGNDALYPEAARVLAYQGAQMLIGLGACPGAGLHRKVRAGLLARVQENQLYGLISFLVGHNVLGLGERQDYAGQSAIFAPAEFTLRYSGVMVELGTASSEGVITAEWDFGALQELWAESDTPLRRVMPMAAFGALADRYEEGRTLHEVWPAPPPGAVTPPWPEIMPVEALPTVAVAPPEPPVEALPALPEALPEEPLEELPEELLEELPEEELLEEPLEELPEELLEELPEELLEEPLEELPEELLEEVPDRLLEELPDR